MHPKLILDIVQRGDLDTISRGVDLTRADYPVMPDADPIGNQMATEGLAYWPFLHFVFTLEKCSEGIPMIFMGLLRI